MSTCPVCELHAESTFKIEGMDCHEEVAILEHRLKRLAGLEALDADVMGQRLRIKYDAAKLSAGSHCRGGRADGHARVARARGAAHRRRPRPRRGSGSLILSGVAFARRPGAGSCRAAPGHAGLDSVLRCRLRSAACLPRGGRWRRFAPACLDINVLMLVAVAGAIVARRVGRSGVGRLPLRPGAAARGARHGSGARRDPRADGSRARRSARPTRRPRRARSGRRGARRRHDRGPAGREDPARRPGRRAARATSTRRRSPASRCRSRRCRATRSSPARSTAAARSTCVVTRLRRDSTLAPHHPPGRARAGAARAEPDVRRSVRARLHAGRARARGRDRAGAAARSLGGELERRGSIARWCCSSSRARARSSSRRRCRSSRRWRPRRAEGRADQGRRAPRERLAAIRCVAFDKTGTLTTRPPARRRRRCRSTGAEPSEVLRFAASLEMRSEHPIGRAIVAHARTRWSCGRRGRSDSRRCRDAAPRDGSGRID